MGVTWRLSESEEIQGENLFPVRERKELKDLADSGKLYPSCVDKTPIYGFLSVCVGWVL